MDNSHTSEPENAYSIEPATWRDLNSLRRIEKVCFPKDHWPLLDLISVLTFPNVIRLKAVINGQMVGFIAGDVRSFKKIGWIATICVLPQYRYHGIGSALLHACEKRLNTPIIRLTVRISNKEAQNLYHSLGYQQVDVWPCYYIDGEDAIVLEKSKL